VSIASEPAPARAAATLPPGVSAAGATPPGVKLPGYLQAACFLLWRERLLTYMRRRHGDVFTVNLPVFGRSVMVARPDLVKQVFTAPADVLVFGEISPLGDLIGPGSLFSMDGAEHLRERRLILPAFHGERMTGYEAIIEQEARREMAAWPEGHEFATMPGFMRITLNSILRAVFGAQAEDLADLAEVLPPLVKLASRLTLLPWLRRDLGPRSPGRRLRRLRERYDSIIDRMIDASLTDPRLEERDDVMSMLLRAHYDDDGSSMSRGAIKDELFTLLAAGHETTATSLAWAVERLRRNPWILRRLVDEARDDGAGNALRMATIQEVQRTRPVIPATGRHAVEDFPLGEWVVPRGHHIVVAARMIHNDPRYFELPLQFQPDRFLGVKPDAYTWVPFGGGLRRCPGAAFAHMEMDVVLRVLLREFDLDTTDAPGEAWQDRGVAFAPGDGGLAVVGRRRKTPPESRPCCDQKTTVELPWRITRSSQCRRTARAKTIRSTSAPSLTISSTESACVTRTTSCSMIGPPSSSAVT
jgi:cytochrome P450 family 138